MDRGVLIEVDSRRRLSLRRLADDGDTYFFAQKRPDGSILLTPADVAPRRPVVPDDEMDLIEATITDLRDRMDGDHSSKKSSWWEQRRDQQREGARAGRWVKSSE